MWPFPHCSLFVSSSKRYTIVINVQYMLPIRQLRNLCVDGRSSSTRVWYPSTILLLSPLSRPLSHPSKPFAMGYNWTLILPDKWVSKTASAVVMTLTDILQTYEVYLQGCIYPTSSRAICISIPTCCTHASDTRYLLAESLFEGAALQPYIHNCSIKIVEGRNVSHFQIFFKQHCHLRQNMTAITSRASMRGNMVIMHEGTQKCFVNMRGRDRKLADWAISR